MGNYLGLRGLAGPVKLLQVLFQFSVHFCQENTGRILATVHITEFFLVCVFVTLYGSPRTPLL